MDIELLSGMIGELLPDHDSLALPGLGTFVAEDVSASFSDRGYTLNPPYRRINFVARSTEDGLLSALYARDNDNITSADAEAIIKDFLASLANTLRECRMVELPGIGKLRCTREGDFFFVPDDTLDVSAESCGLTPVSLRTHAAVPLPDIPVLQQAKAASTVHHATEDYPEAPAAGRPAISRTPQADADALAGGLPGSPMHAEPAGATEPAGAPVPAEAPLAESPVPTPAEPAAPAVPAAPARRKPRPLLRAFAYTAAAAVLLLAAFTAFSRLKPGSTDRLLYSAEELEILNYPEDGLGVSR